MTLHSVMSVMHCALRRPLRAQTMALRWNSVSDIKACGALHRERYSTQ